MPARRAQPEVRESLVATPHGAALLRAHPASGPPRASVLLLHGAGSGSDAPILVALATRLAAGGLLALRLDQPYRVAGRRAPAPAPQLDAVVHAIAASVEPPVTLLVGRSSGARVACRVAAGPPQTVLGVVALGFPLVPPPRRPATQGPSSQRPASQRPASQRPGATRGAELAGAGVDVLVVQGERDAFGAPAAVAALRLDGVRVHAVAGADHAFASRSRDGRPAGAAVAEAVDVSARWLLARA